MNINQLEVKDPVPVPASQRLLALYPDLTFDREKAMEALIDRGFGRQTEELSKFPADGTLADLLATFRHDSSKEEFLWAYIEAVTGEKGVHQKEY